jgi:hypothetical protein
MLSQGVAMEDSWNCPASRKSLRTKNPIRAIVDPILAQVRSGAERADGKDPISLAVRIYSCSLSLPARNDTDTCWIPLRKIARRPNN